MLTAAISHPSYFIFGGDRDHIPVAVGLHDALTAEGLDRLCESAYRLFYHCLPLYDQITMMPLLRGLLPERMVFRDDGPPTSEPPPGLVLLKDLAKRGIASYDDEVNDTSIMRENWASSPQRTAMRSAFITPELVERIIGSFPFGEKDRNEIRRWANRLNEMALHEVAGRVTASLRGEKGSLSRGEDEATILVSEVIDELVAFTGYAAQTGSDVYAFKHYMPLLVTRAIQNRTTSTGLRSFSLLLPVINSPESECIARASFAPLRLAIEGYQTALSAGDDDDVFNAFVNLDDARHAALKQVFDPEGRHEIVTVTCLIAEVGGTWQRHFLPDDHFRLSLAMQHWQHLSPEQVTAFETLLDTVLFGVRDLGTDGRIERTLLAACACQPVLDFVIMSQFARLQIEEKPHLRTLGPRWTAIQDKMNRLMGTDAVGKPLAHLGKAVIARRNELSHPAKEPQCTQQTRGDMLSGLCRLVNFIRFLDCSMPP